MVREVGSAGERRSAVRTFVGVPYHKLMRCTLEVERETDGRWIVEIPELPGTLAYGTTQEEAIAKAKVLALRVLADQLENGETNADLDDISFAAA